MEAHAKRLVAAMSFDPFKVLRLEITLILTFLPLVIWLALYLAYRWWSFNSRSMLPWLRTLRWTGWGFGVLLFLLSVAREHFSVVYGIAMTTFSVGLSIPERWVKRRFAPDLIDPITPHGFWPTKPE